MSIDTVTGPEPDDEPGRGAEVYHLDWRRRGADAPENTEPADDTETDEAQAPGAGERKLARPVDSADLPEVDRIASVLASRRRPIVPAWAQSTTEARRTARIVTGHYAHVAGFHAVRIPLSYAPRLVLRSPRGLGRVLRSLVA